jgi:hypothetical protein
MEILRGPFGQGRVLQNGEWRNVTDREVAERVVQWGKSLDRERLHNLGKWAQMIHATCTVDQPELLIEIDLALDQRNRMKRALEKCLEVEASLPPTTVRMVREALNINI